VAPPSHTTAPVAESDRILWQAFHYHLKVRKLTPIPFSFIFLSSALHFLVRETLLTRVSQQPRLSQRFRQAQLIDVQRYL
jgi:hypothetical protein